MDTAARFDRLDRFIREGRIVRGGWGDGQERARLLLAIAPEVGQGNIAACPASLIPPWLAELTNPIGDRVAQEDWPDIVATYARVVRLGSERLDDAGWGRVLARFFVAMLGDLQGEHPAKVAAMWQRVLDGDEPTESELQGAGERAAAAAGAAEAKAESAVAGAAEASAAAWAAAWAAASAASTAAWASSEAVSWSRIARHLFAAIEAEVGA